MQAMMIRTVNSTFETLTEAKDIVTVEEALNLGIRSAMAINADDVDKGHPAASVVISVEDSDARTLARAVVTVSVSRIMID